MASLDQIQAFLEVARSGSFARASERLSVPRSTVSARVRSLEDQLTVRLLHRTTRRVALTDEGRRYLTHCEEAMRRLDEAESELRRPNRIEGTIRITVPVDLPNTPLADLIVSFTALHPDIHIDIVATDEVLDLVEKNIDLAIRGGAPGNKDLVARKLGEGRVCFFASRDYAAHLPTRGISLGDEHAILDPVQRLPGKRGAKARRARIYTRNFELAKALAIRSQGVALLPEGMCVAELKSGALQEVNCDVRIAPLPLYLVMPTRRHVPPRVRTFVDFLTEPARQRTFL
jgi:DNA-binding transcriptional LysR family regulator